VFMSFPAVQSPGRGGCRSKLFYMYLR